MRRVERYGQGLGTLVALGALTLTLLGPAAAGAKSHHPRVKLCKKTQLTAFKLRSGSEILAKPGKRPPKGGRLVCLNAPSFHASPGSASDTVFNLTFAQLPARVQHKLHPLDIVIHKLLAAAQGEGSPSPAARLRTGARAGAAASGSSSASAGDASGNQSGQSSNINTPDTSGFDGSFGVDAKADGAEGNATVSESASKHYQNDKCPGADGKLRNGTYDQEIHFAVRFKLRKGGHGAITRDYSIKGTYEADIGDDGEPTQLTMPLSFEERDHRALPPSDYGYGVFTATTTVTMNLKDPNGPWQSTRPTVAVRGTIDATAAVSMLKTAISESVTEAANEVMRRAWQEPNACAQLHVSADQTTAPRGGQIKLTFSATAHDGSPLSTPLTITTSCPGKLSDTHPSTDGSGIATVTLTDPNSQWHDSTGACVHATMQTRAGRGETDRTIPAQPSNRDRVTGTLSISVTYHDTCDTGQGLNETDNWSGTGNIDESTDPVNTDPDTRFTHNSMLTFGGTWSSGGCSDPYTGQTSGTDSGSSQASVTGQDGISDSNGGVSAYFDTPSQGQLTLYLDWPVDGTDNCQDLGASHVTGDLGTEIVLPIPTSGGGTVNVDKVLTYGSGDNQWTNGWGPSCSGTPPDPGTNVHITGSLNVQRAG